jgi:release factor glutamine methyltransferase
MLPTLRDLLRTAIDALERHPDTADGAALDAALLLAHSLGHSRSFLYAHPETPIPPPVQRQIQTLVERRSRGEPVAYLIGRREFWSLDLEVTPDTLIPRPETERLVEVVLDRLTGTLGSLRILDLGTGSGAIAAALAHERPDWQITATEVSPTALAVARRNFLRLGLTRIFTALGSWYAPLPANARFHAIASNPPYVAEQDPHLGCGALPWEPGLALRGGADGLSAIRDIVADAPGHLLAGGWLVLEHACEHPESVRNLLIKRGFYNVATEYDLAGRERVSLGQWPV